MVKKVGLILCMAYINYHAIQNADSFCLQSGSPSLDQSVVVIKTWNLDRESFRTLYRKYKQIYQHLFCFKITGHNKQYTIDEDEKITTMLSKHIQAN